MANLWGYDSDRVLASREGRIGWLNPTETGYNIVDCDNQESTIGRYFNDDGYNGIIKVQYLWDCMNDPDATEEQKNDYLRQLVTSVTQSALNKVLPEPKLIDNGLLFEKYENTTLNTIANGGKFCGQRFKLTPKPYAVQLHQVILHFDGAVDLPLYLFNEFAGIVAQWTVEVPNNAPYAFPVDEVIKHTSDVNYGGNWFLCYNQDDLGSVKAIDYTTRCNQYNVFKHSGFEAAKITATDFERQNYADSSQTYGMNVQVSSFKDYTDTIINNNKSLDELIGLMMALKTVDIVTTSPRANSSKSITKEIIARMMQAARGVPTESHPLGFSLQSEINKQVKVMQNFFDEKPKAMIVSGC